MRRKGGSRFTPTPMRGIAAAICAVGVFSFTGGITFPLLSFIMERHGSSPTMIGINGAMMPLGVIFCALVLPWLARSFSAFHLSIGAFVASTLIILGISLTLNFWLWFPLRFALGVAINILFVTSETWINQLAPSRIRGRIMGVYVTVSAGCFALGPILLSLVGTEGFAPFAFAIASPLLALPLLFWARPQLSDRLHDEQGGSIANFAAAAPVLLLLIGLVALYDQTALAIFPVFGLASGLSEQTTSWALSVTIFGNVLLQIPLGLIADRYDRRAIALALAATTAICLALLPQLVGTVWSWPLFLVIGAAGFGGFTIAMVELGDRFTGSMLLAGNAGFALMWGLGGLVGPPIAGGAMDAMGPNGYPATMAAMFGVLAFILVTWPLVRRASPSRA